MSTPANPPPGNVPGGRPPDTEPAPLLSFAPPGARPTPPPLEANTPRLVLIGMALWAAAFVVLLTRRDQLVADGNGFWLWTCVAGVLLGLLGFLLAVRARRPR